MIQLLADDKHYYLILKKHVSHVVSVITVLNPPQMIDGTEYAQMVLSAIYRTGQYFGSGHIVDVLRGVDSDKVKAKGHDKIKTLEWDEQLRLTFGKHLFVRWYQLIIC